VTKKYKSSLVKGGLYFLVLKFWSLFESLLRMLKGTGYAQVPCLLAYQSARFIFKYVALIVVPKAKQGNWT